MSGKGAARCRQSANYFYRQTYNAAAIQATTCGVMTKYDIFNMDSGVRSDSYDKKVKTDVIKLSKR